MKHLIIGNGIAGIHAAETIRTLDPECTITLIGGEPTLPYSRPMIALLLEGSIPSERMVIRDEECFRSLRIRHVTGEWVEHVDPDRREARTRKGRVYPYDRLLIATGADPLPVEAEGAGLENIFFMRSEAHVGAISGSLSWAKRALVVGCGLVGLKAAQALHHRGLGVTVVEKLDFPLPLVVDPEAGKRVARVLREMGITFLPGRLVTAFGGNGKVKEAHLSDGTGLSCDIVVLGVGFKPALSFMPPNTLPTRDGILVDAHLETGLKGIYAAGDVAETVDLARGGTRINAVWPVAAEQGVIAGMNMAGRETAYPGSLGRNVFRIGETDVLTAGFVHPRTDGLLTVLAGEDRTRGTYRKFVFRDDRLVGMVMVNAIEQGGVLLSLIHRKIPITLPKERLFHRSFNFSTLLPRIRTAGSF